MIAVANFAWVVLCAAAVWAGTRQRFGTADELRTFAAVIAALVISAGLSILGALPAGAHGLDDIEDFETRWADELRTLADAAAATGGLDLRDLDALIAERVDFESRHGWYYNPVEVRDLSRRSGPSVPYSVESWRPLVSRYFATGDVDRALCLIGHESGGDPNARNPRSGATGLFQVMPFWADHFGGNLYDPATNVSIAARIRDLQGWTAWSPYNRGLCR